MCGRETIRRFLDWARKQKKKALRMYATADALPVWRDSWGFGEAETVLDADGNIKYGPEKRHSYPKESSFRLTLILP